MHFNTIQQFGLVFENNINHLQPSTKRGQIEHWYKGIKGRIWNLKNWIISLIYWFLNFYLNTFLQGCSKKILKKRNETFPLMNYFIWKLEWVSNRASHWKPSFGSNSLQTPLSLVSSAILVTLIPFTLF